MTPVAQFGLKTDPSIASMITWAGLIGKVFGFVAQELAKKALNARPDKGAAACEAFTRLYFNICQLESLTEYILDGIDLETENGSSMILVSRVFSRQQEMERLSMEFFETAQILRGVLEVFEPETERALGAVFAWKGSILWEASQSITVQRGQKLEIAKLQYKKPSDKILELNISAYLEDMRTNPRSTTWDNMCWPETLLGEGEMVGAFSDSEIELTSKADLQEFADLLRSHLLVLGDAKGAVRLLIKTHFSLEDVLFQKWSAGGF